VTFCDHRDIVELVDREPTRPSLVSKHRIRSQRRSRAGSARRISLIATDGFEYDFGVIVRLMGPACVYGQVIKTRWNNRVVRVDQG
jgi:hypothetical protein